VSLQVLHGAGEGYLDRLVQRIDIEGLGECRDAVLGKPALFVAELIRRRRPHNDRNGTGHRVHLQLLEHLSATGRCRKHEIKQHDVWCFTFEPVKGSVTIGACQQLPSLVAEEVM